MLHTGLSRFWAVLTLYKRGEPLTEAADFNGSRLLLSFISGEDQYISQSYCQHTRGQTLMLNILPTEVKNYDKDDDNRNDDKKEQW